jgi:hypothetical protein
VEITPALIAMRPAAPKATPMRYEINKEFNRLNSGLLAESLRQAGTLDAIINSRAVDVIASNTTIVSIGDSFGDIMF